MPEPETPAWEALRLFVGASDDDATFVQQCWAEATALVTAKVTGSGKVVGDEAGNVPTEIAARATLNCGSELYHARQAPNGVAQFAAFDGSAIRVARDPMVAAYPILAPYLGLGFA